MVAAAVEAGRAECEIYAGAFRVHHKQDASPVTEADHAAEAIILERLAKVAPSVPIVAEEEVAAGRIPRVAGEFFLVDPLDGTKEFIAKRGDFTVNIALVRDGAPVLGVVFAPANEKLFVGDVTLEKPFALPRSRSFALGAARSHPGASAACSRPYSRRLAVSQQCRHGRVPEAQ